MRKHFLQTIQIHLRTMNKNYIFGIRTIIEAIESGKDIDKVLIRKDLGGDLAKELWNLMKSRGIVWQKVPVEKLNRVTMKNHQGAIAFLSPITYYNLSDLLPSLYEEGELPLIIALDGITDTRNFGAIGRTAECAGVNAIVIPEHGSVSVNADAVKTSAGALLHIPVCREKSITAALKLLKENGFQIIGASEKTDQIYTQSDYTLPTVIVMGSEETGLSPAVLDLCDKFAAIPILGSIGSLNVSVAAGILVYEAVRQRLNSGFCVE